MILGVHLRDYFSSCFFMSLHVLYGLIEEFRMKIPITKLPYKSVDILKALDRNENVVLLHQGKIKGIISPAKKESVKRVKDHPFFGMYKETKVSVLDELENLRSPKN
jgi:hypothetical protein